MRTLFIILTTIIAFAGCKKNLETAAQTYIGPKNPDTTVIIKSTNTDTIKYLALGDSYTIGQSEPLAQSFPYQLTASLKSNSFNALNPTIIATTGWTTDDLIAGITAADISANKYDLVTLLIGVNDQHLDLSQADYRTNFAALVQTAIAFAKGDKTRVFVLSIPDYGVTPYGGGRDATIGPEIDQFNAINKDESTKAGVNYLDITAISRTAAEYPDLIAPDGLHPSPKMYAEWVARLEPMVATRLNKK